MLDITASRRSENSSEEHNGGGQTNFPSDDGTGVRYRATAARSRIALTTAATKRACIKHVPKVRTWRLMTLLDHVVPRVAHSWSFMTFMNLVIIASCVLVGFSVDAEKYGLHADDVGFWVAENLFLLCFVFEYAANVFTYRAPFAKSAWGLFDVVILVCGILSVWVLGIVRLALKDPKKASLLAAVESFASFRILRLFQLVRTVRLWAMFRILWSMVRGLAAALGTLLWTLCLMIIIFYLFAILGVEIVGKNEFLKTYPDPEVVKLVETKFGGVLNALLAALQIATLDSWNSEIASNIIHASAKDSENSWRCALISLYFVSLVAMGGLVLMNLVTAVILEQSLEGSKMDIEALAAWESDQVRQIIAALEEAFLIADVDQNGELSWEELETAYTDPKSKMSPFLTQLGSLADIEQIFFMLDVNDRRSLTMQEFTDGIQRCKDDFSKFVMRQVWKKHKRFLERLDEFLATKGPSQRASARNTFSKLTPALQDTGSVEGPKRSTSTNIGGVDEDKKAAGSTANVRLMNIKGASLGFRERRAPSAYLNVF